MGENIELHTYCVSTANDPDNNIDEYHEITAEKETPVSPKLLQIKDYDFFTQIDIKTNQRISQKHKKVKVKKEIPPSLMDIVNSELASAASFVTGNIITMRNEREMEQNSYLLRLPNIQSLFQKSHVSSYDYRWRQQQNVRLSPIFPRILESVISDDYNIPVQYSNPMLFDEYALERQPDKNGEEKFLVVIINNIKFLHHHSFSLEKLLCEKLVDIFNVYRNCKRMMESISRDIKVNRETRDNIKLQLLGISPNKKDEVRFDSTIRKYTGKLLQLKDQYRELMKTKKKSIHQLISLWSDIKLVRDKFDEITVPYVLNIINRDTNENKFEEAWMEAYNLEYNDYLDKLEYEYVTEYLQYKEIKNNNSGKTKKSCKPKLQIDEDALKGKVNETVNDLIKADKIDVTLDIDESILNESKSIKYFNKLKYHFNIFVDSVFVCRSETYTAKNKNELNVDFNESFSVQILAKNKTFTMVLLENDEEVSVLNIDLNKIHQSDNTAEFVTEKLVYKNILTEPTRKFVGTGFNIKNIAKVNEVRLKSSNLFDGNLETTCVLSTKIAWDEKLNRNESTKEFMDVGRKIKRLINGMDKPNADIISNLINKIYDVDISSNESVLQTLRSTCKSNIRNSIFEFPINENNPDFVRLKLLHLRNIGGFSSIEDKLVPIHTSQISTEQLSRLQKINDKDVGVEYIYKYSELDPIELQRFIGCKYVQKLNRNMLTNVNDHLMQKTHKDVVRDYRDLSWRNIFSNQTSLITLASLPKSTKQQYLNEALNKEQEIQVTIIRAFNLMDRSTAILSDDDHEDEETIAGFRVRPLRPYVKLSYHGNSAQTGTAIGCHPTWNQTIKMKTKLLPMASLHINLFDEFKTNLSDVYMDDDNVSQGRTVHYRYSDKWLGTLQVPLYSVLNMGTLRCTMKITTPPIVFGYDVPHNKDATYSMIPEVKQLLKKDTSFINFQITTSLSHLGGLNAYNQPIPNNPDDDDVIKHLNAVVTDYINDFPTRTISLTFIDSSGRNKCVTQFLQPIPLHGYEYFPKNPKVRVESALSKSSGVSKSSSSKSSGGRRKDTDIEANQEEKESVYSGFDGSSKGESQMVKMLNACLRYVSLIPTYEVSESHVVTLTGLELLKVLYGSPLDHTILLASYFLYLGIKCWVVIGRGLPRGLSSYVLTKYDLTTRRDVFVTDQLFKNTGFFNKNDGYLWNVYDAVSGERFELRDVSCPLKTVDYVFDNENLWLNMQTSLDCENMSFDLTRSSNWLSVFDKRIFILSQPLVSDPSLYSPAPDVTALRDTLESKIKTKVQKWRSRLKTIWNRYCSSLLRELLPQWEYWTFHPADPKPTSSQRLKQLMITYKLFGFPLNVPYVNAKSVLSTVKATGVHLNDDANVEFGLAVEVYAYPNNVLSVWVFLASVARI